MAVKKKRGAKAAKAKKQEKKSSKLAKTDTDLSFSVKDKDGPKDAAKPRDPTVPAKRAQLASKGKAIKSRARTAEREQRRLHGTHLAYILHHPFMGLYVVPCLLTCSSAGSCIVLLHVFLMLALSCNIRIICSSVRGPYKC